MKKIDLTGQNFGDWIVLYELKERKNKKIYYHCKCSCGKEKDVMGQHLKDGTSTNCGCIRDKKTSQRQFKDITNQKFGRLTVKSIAGKDKDGHILWYCDCDCGNKNIIKMGKNLRQGETLSCGCLKSKGEEIIAKILRDNNIIFEQEKKFNNFIYKDSNRKAQFDFFVNNKYIIEFDGKQHFNIGGWNDNKALEKNFKHDKLKNEYCLKNNIPLIRIPYTHLKKICLNDLLLETSNFIVKGE